MRITMQMSFVCRFLPRLAYGIHRTINFKNSMQITKINSLRSIGSSKHESNSTHDQKSVSNLTWKPIYTMPNIRAASLIHRLKLCQTVFTIVVTPMTIGFYCYGKTNITTVLVVTGVASFTCLSLYVLTSFFKRLIGIIYIDEDKKYLKIAHLTFWGKRKDIIIPVDEIIPLSDCDNNPLDAFVKLHRTNSNETFYMTLRFGKILDPDVFKKVFGSFEILKSKK